MEKLTVLCRDAKMKMPYGINANWLRLVPRRVSLQIYITKSEVLTRARVLEAKFQFSYRLAPKDVTNCSKVHPYHTVENTNHINTTECSWGSEDQAGTRIPNLCCIIHICTD